MEDFTRWRRPRDGIFPSLFHQRLLHCFNITIRPSFAIICCLELSLSRRFQVWYDPVPNFGCGGILLYSRATSSLMELRPKCRFGLFYWRVYFILFFIMLSAAAVYYIDVALFFHRRFHQKLQCRSGIIIGSCCAISLCPEIRLLSRV